VLSWIGADVLHLSWADRSRVVALLVATVGAVLFGGVLGELQWQVIRQRVPVPRKRWIVANIGPALVGWLFVIVPAVTSAQESGTSVSGAYLLAASQTLALGPLLGLSQASVLRPHTRRWAGWIFANLASWRRRRLSAKAPRRWLAAIGGRRRDSRRRSTGGLRGRRPGLDSLVRGKPVRARSEPRPHPSAAGPVPGSEVCAAHRSCPRICHRTPCRGVASLSSDRLVRTWPRSPACSASHGSSG